MPPLHYTTGDLYEAAYLMMQGCEVFGITKISPYSSTITLTAPERNIQQMVLSYKKYEVVGWSPRLFAEKRDELKRLIKMQPEV